MSFSPKEYKIEYVEVSGDGRIAYLNEPLSFILKEYAGRKV